MNAFLRSRLCYNIATWNNPDHFVKRLDVVWNRMLRKVLKNGFKRKPDSKSFIYSNKDPLRITGCKSVQIFPEKQQVKWTYCVRMENDALQKLSFFMTTTKKNYKSVWSRIEYVCMYVCSLQLQQFDAWTTIVQAIKQALLLPKVTVELMKFSGLLLE